MNSSLLRQYKIAIYGKNIITNEYGEYKEEKYLKCHTRAGLLNQSQSHSFSNDENQFPLIKTILVRHYINIEAGDEIELEGKYYDVVGVDDNLYYHNKQISIVLKNI